MTDREPDQEPSWHTFNMPSVGKFLAWLVVVVLMVGTINGCMAHDECGKFKLFSQCTDLEQDNYFPSD